MTTKIWFGKCKEIYPTCTAYIQPLTEAPFRLEKARYPLAKVPNPPAVNVTHAWGTARFVAVLYLLALFTEVVISIYLDSTAKACPLSLSIYIYIYIYV